MEFQFDIYDTKIITSLFIICIISLYYAIFTKKQKSLSIESISENIMNHLSSELKIKYELIETENSLINLITEILDNNISKIGLDTEYYKGNNYQGHLCLFQISYILNENKKIYIIDLLKFDKNLIKKNFEQIFNNEKIEKIIHASENDIEWIYEDYGIFVKNVFDTQEVFTHIADSNKRVGLNFLINFYFKLNLEKQTKKYFQTSNWKQRPLHKEQLDYAALDTSYLIDIREKIYLDLKNKMNVIKKKKKKRLIETAESLMIDVENVSFANNENNSNENINEIFNLKDFEEIHKKTDYDKILTSIKLKLNEKLKKKLLTFNRAQRNEEKALVYFFNNLVKCESTKASYLKKIFLDVFHFNEEYASINNINPDRIINGKIIYKLVNAHPESYEQLDRILSEDLNSLLNDGNSEIFNEITKREFKQKLFALLEKLIKEERDFLLNAKLAEESDFKQVKATTKSETNRIPLAKKGDKPSKESKEIKMDKIIKKFSCKKPVYENCKMLAPDGEMLCFCDKRKMLWYLERGLGEQVETDPPTFKLKFEPNSRGCVDEGNKKSDFYTTDRRNCCVVCGLEKNYMRFYVIPVIYRTYLPHYLKSHKSHDVLLLCFNCHEKANKLYDVRKRELAIKYDCPLNTLSEEQKALKIVSKLKRNAQIMIKNYSKLPFDRKSDLGGEILECFKDNKGSYMYESFFLYIFTDFYNENDNYNNKKTNGNEIEKDLEKENDKFIESTHNKKEELEEEDEISDEDIEEIHKKEEILKAIEFPSKIDDLTEELLIKISKFDIKKLRIGDKKSMHGKLVIDKIKNNFEEFIRSWREYFVKVMEPKFLPDAWNINHQFQRTFGEYSKFSKEI